MRESGFRDVNNVRNVFIRRISKMCTKEFLEKFDFGKFISLKIVLARS